MWCFYLEQSQILEAKLTAQDVEQSKKILRENLRKESEKQSQILEAKLKAHVQGVD